MLLKLVKNSLVKEKALYLILFTFIMTASCLASTGVLMLTQLNQAISQLMIQAKAPDMVQLHQGEIAVPIYFMHANGLKNGDTVKIVQQEFVKEWTIVAFVRDVLTNPAFVHSKRFVISEADFTLLKTQHIGNTPHFIEFRLTAPEAIGTFTEQYRISGLPQNGPTLDYRLIRILNGIADGIAIGLLILMSLILVLVALLCLRLVISTAIEQDYRQVGMMKAVGIPTSFTYRVHLLKYAALAAVACMEGYSASFAVQPLLAAHIRDYLGPVPSEAAQRVLPLVSAALIFLTIVAYSAFALRRFLHISVVESIRECGREGLVSLHMCGRLNPHVFLALKDLFQRGRAFLFLSLVFCLCIIAIILPLNFFNTLQSPSFVHYMGIVPSDMRIDLRHESPHEIVDCLAHDTSVKEYRCCLERPFWH